MMTCDEARVLLHALLDGELDAGHAREVEAHVAGCPRCAAEIAQFREMRKAMAGANLSFIAQGPTGITPLGTSPPQRTRRTPRQNPSGLNLRVPRVHRGGDLDARFW